VDIFSMQFLYALGAIIVIDLVLAGDNAVVIALAARNLPDNLRKKAIIWGTAGAIVVRSAMTVAVVWLLKIPGLQGAGGALLIWIAIKLLAPTSEEGEGEHAAAMGFWGAMQTIVIADAVMGLDNVLAVAGASHGNYLLVILGLLISLPIVVWGSSIILKWIDRFPIIIYAGAGILVWTAAKMIIEEPLLKAYLGGLGAWHYLVMAVMVAAVLGYGYYRNVQAKRSQGIPGVTEVPAGEVPLVVDTPVTPPEVAVAPPAEEVAGVPAVRHVLLPVNDTAAARAAAAQLISELRNQQNVRVHVLHVAPRMPRHITRFLKAEDRQRWLEQRAKAAVEPVTEKLDAARIDHMVHVQTARGVANGIVAAAESLNCERIIIGAVRKSDIVRLFTGSITGRVLARSAVPVEVVLAGEASLITRLGVPAGVGLAMFALLLEID
jgi:YjbE family integral membrane protein